MFGWFDSLIHQMWPSMVQYQANRHFITNNDNYCERLVDYHFKMHNATCARSALYQLVLLINKFVKIEYYTLFNQRLTGTNYSGM